MAKSTSLNFTQNLKLSATTIVAADTTTLKTLFTAGANDSVVKSLHAISDDSAAKVVNVYVNNGSSDVYIGAVNVPITSGTTGAIAAVDLLSGTLFPNLPYDANGKRVLPLPAGYIVKVSVQATVTAAKTITITCMAEDY